MWGDSGQTGAARGDLGQLLAHMQKIPRAYLRIIRTRIAEARRESGTANSEKEEQARNS